MSDKTQRLLNKNCYAVTRGHDFIDIDGVKWATCNLGAKNPEDPGLYFRWGDKKGFYIDEIKSHNTSWLWFDLNGDIPTVWDDPVHTLWGGKWRLPTVEEAKTLVKLCSLAPEDVDGNFHVIHQNFEKVCDLKLPLGGYISDGKLKANDISSYL